jgi:gliding motility-associated-like protein
MSRLHSIVILLFAAAGAFHCQNENAKWYFGQNAGIDFMTSPPTSITGSMVTQEGCASVSNSSGSLLFYTDGITIYTSTHTIMANGSGLAGNFSSTQSAVIVRRPGSNTIYYVFTQDAVGGTNGIRYSIVDMSLSAGSGSVTTKNVLLHSPCTEKLTSVKHCNGTDVWVLSHDVSPSVNFRAFLVTATGVNTTAVTSSGPGVGTVGYMKFSPNGKKLGVGNYTGSYFIYDFDASTGAITNSLSLSLNGGGYGCEFSPDGTKFYGCTTGAIYQWDLCAGSPTAIAASAFSTTSSSTWGMQLAINGKIYVTRYLQTVIGVIHNPNASGSNCNYVDQSFTITPNNCRIGLPNFITSGFKSPPPPFTFTVSNSFGCQTASFTASPAVNTASLNNCVASGYSLTGIKWNFGDPNSGSSNTTTATNPSHAFTTLGTYTVSLIMYYSCGGGTDTIRQAVNINQPCISVTSTSITCATLGSATVQATGGIGPFSYTWMPTNQTSSVATGLAPGLYTLTVFDFGNNFTYTAQTLFTSLIPLTGNISHAGSVSCNGANTATGNVTNLAGGSGTQTTIWTNGTATLTGESVNALGAGLWSVTVTDALTGCQLNDLFLITQPFAQGLNISASSPTACAGASISFTGVGFGGTPGYTYSWSAGPASDTHTVSEASGGNYVYSLTATDANTCSVSQTVMVSFISNPVLSLPSVSICPLQTGTLTAGGATSYTWSTSATTGSISDSPTVTTVYTVTGESSGCISTTTGAIVLKTVPAPLMSSNSPRCNGQSLNLFGGGGTGYLWNGPQSFTSAAQNPVLNSATPSNSGVYQVTVTAANGCTASTSGTFTVHPTPTVSASAGTVCVNTVLQLNASSVPGAGFTWSGPVNFNSTQQNPSLSNVSVNRTGNYFVVATSAAGCTNITSAHGSVVPQPTVSFTTNSPRCLGQDLVLNASATAGGQVFSWAGPNGFASASVVNTITAAGTVAAGIYQLVVTTGPCTASLSQAVIIHPLPSPVVSYNGPVCENRSMIVTVSTPPNQNITGYNWQTPAGLTSPNNLIAVNSAGYAHSGVYSATVTDTNGCKASASSTIIVLQNPTVTAASATVCLYQPATLTAQGAKDYFWIGPGLAVPNGANAVVGSAVSLQGVSYLVIGTAVNGCTSAATASLSAWPLPVPLIAVSPANRICLNGTTVLRGLGGKYYEWYGPHKIYHAGEHFSVTATSIIFDGTYTLVATDDKGCQGKATTNISVTALPEGGLTGTAMEECVPFCSDFSFRPAAGQPSLVASWQIFEGGKLKMNFSNTEKFTWCFKTAGDHLIRGSFEDPASGCRNTGTFTVSAHPPPEADFTWKPEMPVEKEDAVLFLNNSDGASQTGWDWFFINDATRFRGENQQFSFGEAGVFPVALVVRNTWGCSDSVVKNIEVLPDFHVFIPNAFTPNTDGKNETFTAVTRGVREYHLAVFNRWGEKIFESTDPATGWDGSYKGGPCQQDVYAWQIYVISHSGERRELKGSVTLYR